MTLRQVQLIPLHSEVAGIVERHNQAISNYLSLCVSDNRLDLDKFVRLFLLSYRSSQLEATRYTPSMLLIGREMKLLTNMMYGNPRDVEESDSSFQCQCLEGTFKNI